MTPEDAITKEANSITTKDAALDLAIKMLEHIKDGGSYDSYVYLANLGRMKKLATPDVDGGPVWLVELFAQGEAAGEERTRIGNTPSDGTDDDPEDTTVCPECKGTKVADDDKGRRPCPRCDGEGTIATATDNRFDYKNQAWIIGGLYQDCGHPEGESCGCYGRAHKGERASALTGKAYVEPRLVCGHTQLVPNCDACRAWQRAQ